MAAGLCCKIVKQYNFPLTGPTDHNLKSSLCLMYRFPLGVKLPIHN